MVHIICKKTWFSFDFYVIYAYNEKAIANRKAKEHS